MARLRATFPMPLRWPIRDPKVGPGPLHTPSDLTPNAVRDLSAALNILLADMFALYLKTKNFHWHMSGSHFRNYHLLLDEQGDQIFATADAIAERVRKIGGTTRRTLKGSARRSRPSTTSMSSMTKSAVSSLATGLTCCPSCRRKETEGGGNRAVVHCSRAGSARLSRTRRR